MRLTFAFLWPHKYHDRAKKLLHTCYLWKQWSIRNLRRSSWLFEYLLSFLHMDWLPLNCFCKLNMLVLELVDPVKTIGICTRFCPFLLLSFRDFLPYFVIQMFLVLLNGSVSEWTLTNVIGKKAVWQGMGAN